MPDFDSLSPEPLPAFASEWLAQRRVGFAKLEQMRRDELRAMSEADAARIFDQLDPPRPYELRSSSGLVEQQRWFKRLSNKTKVQSKRQE